MTGTERRRSPQPPTHAVGRLLMLVFWSLVVWGTVYGIALLPDLLARGPARLLRAVLGNDPWTGGLNVLLAATALCVWVLVGLAVWRRWAERRRSEDPADGGPR